MQPQKDEIRVGAAHAIAHLRSVRYAIRASTRAETRASARIKPAQQQHKRSRSPARRRAIDDRDAGSAVHGRVSCQCMSRVEQDCIAAHDQCRTVRGNAR